MSTTLSSTAPPATNICATVPYNQIPTTDIACAVADTSGLPPTYPDLMKRCCKSAPVEKFASDCALYCLAVDQSVADLIKCLGDAGIEQRWIYCRGDMTATATGTPSGTGAEETGADGKPKETGKAGGEENGKKDGAAAVSKVGLGVLGLLAVSSVFGVMM